MPSAPQYLLKIIIWMCLSYMNQNSFELKHENKYCDVMINHVDHSKKDIHS